MDLNKHAPRPTKASLTQAIWDELYVLEGAKVPRLVRLSRGTHEEVARCLDYGQRWGYFVHDPAADTWKIAPISHWQARKFWRDERRASWRKSKAKAAGSAPKREPPVQQQGQPDWIWIALGTTLFWLVVIGLFGLGYLAG